VRTECDGFDTCHGRSVRGQISWRFSASFAFFGRKGPILYIRIQRKLARLGGLLRPCWVYPLSTPIMDTCSRVISEGFKPASGSPLKSVEQSHCSDADGFR